MTADLQGGAAVAPDTRHGAPGFVVGPVALHPGFGEVVYFYPPILGLRKGCLLCHCFCHLRHSSFSLVLGNLTLSIHFTIQVALISLAFVMVGSSCTWISQGDSDRQRKWRVYVSERDFITCFRTAVRREFWSCHQRELTFKQLDMLFVPIWLL